MRATAPQHAGSKQFSRPPQVAVERAVVYDKCSGLSGAAKQACQLDKALVNVASIFAQQVEGRVSTEIDPRAAFDTGASTVFAESSGPTSDQQRHWSHMQLKRVHNSWHQGLVSL